MEKNFGEQAKSNVYGTGKIWFHQRELYFRLLN